MNQIKIECNNCGSGKTLYYFIEGGTDEGTIKEYTDIQKETWVSDLSKGCPACGSENIIESK